MVYCKLSSKPGAKRRSCTLTVNAHENSNECVYDSSAKKCYVNNKANKKKSTFSFSTNQKPPAPPVTNQKPPPPPVTNQKPPAPPVTNQKPPAPPVTNTKLPNFDNNIQVSTLMTTKNETEYKSWINRINTDKSFKIERKKPIGNTKPIFNPTSIKNIPRKDVPDKAISLVTYMSYNDDDDYKNIKFHKLETCKNCPNNGIFAKNDLDNMLTHGYDSCPLCKESYNLSNIPDKPPFGVMSYTVFKSGAIEWHSLNFNLYENVYKRTERAYYPKCKEGDLALWLVCEAWKLGKLFTMGTSVTTGKYGIVFSGIHLRTNIKYGFTNHGYSSNPKEDMKDILTNLINECNAFNIFTPSQLDDFAGLKPDDTKMTPQHAAKLIKKLLLKRQIDKSNLRKQHKLRMNNLPRLDYFLMQLYPSGFLQNVIRYNYVDWRETTSSILNTNKGVVTLKQTRINPLRHIYSDKSLGYSDMKGLDYKDVPRNILPMYIVNLSNIITEFPRTSKPFYVYRGVSIQKKKDFVSPHTSINVIPFSSSLNAWLALNFARLDKDNYCCLYRIKVDKNVPCIMLGDTLFDSLKNENIVDTSANLNNSKGDLSKNIQFEVLLAPGILKEKSRKISYKITDKKEYEKLNKTLEYKGQQKQIPPPMENTGVLMIDMEYIPLHTKLIDNKETRKYEVFV